ncbi:MAG: pseudaminic acid synthase [Candidatus Rokubacteria bacterium]|nr:pseudaminic acid synthase [Candidatus Rokubacteria bacterium]
MTTTPSITINGRRIGRGHPTYVVAEMSANHHQRYDEAVEIIHAAKAAGADAVKLQTYTADTITIDGAGAEFRVPDGSLWSGRTLHDLYEEAHTPWAWQPRLKAEADRLGLDCFSSPFDASAVDFLETMDVPAYKVASFELVDLGLIERIARTGRPMIMSTGMGTPEEIAEALAAARGAGARDVALLKCTSAYPAPPDEMNVGVIPHLAERFGVPVGLSDHSLAPAVAVAAVALGACIVEKHFTLSRAAGGPDSAFSLEPAEFRELVDAIRVAERSLGSGVPTVTDGERANRIFRRSLYVVEAVAAGEPFTEKNVRSIRPAFGLPPKHLRAVLGRTAARAIPRGTPLAWEHVDGAAR